MCYCRVHIYTKIFLDDSTEVMEGVTWTPEIFSCKIVLSLHFSKQIQSTLTADFVNLI